ncbi:hypothetical protein CANINC_003424 [Pichia inconspicua]|uniref:GOLD domain-containing protein n=1 Tax=Pichia inconspicua TaxID=52247 RepID=A0A4T0WYH8_9ASCO|nr:hypothetical protein CANINC_003424 [[Candida] inconspicua]
MNLNFLFGISLLIRLAFAVVSIGIEVPPSESDSADLVTELNLLHQELYAIDKPDKETQKAETIKEKIDKLVGVYVGKHRCIRYYLKEYFLYDEDEIDSHINSGLFINLHFKFENLDSDSRKQYLNLLFLDKNADVLRKISKVNDRYLSVLLDYPLVDKSEEYFNKQYFDVCLENIQYDKSWNAKLDAVDAYIEFSFGLDAISSIYDESSEIVDTAGENLMKVEKELDTILKQYLNMLKTTEPQFRDKNEDTLTKYMICFAIIFVIYVIVNIAQIIWLIKYLKSHGLL